jgi:hypothetical protein
MRSPIPCHKAFASCAVNACEKSFVCVQYGARALRNRIQCTPVYNSAKHLECFSLQRDIKPLLFSAALPLINVCGDESQRNTYTECDLALRCVM